VRPKGRIGHGGSVEDPGGREGERENTRVKINRGERRKQEEGKRGKKGKDNAETWRTRSIAE
jgi:hypothetical protein